MNNAGILTRALSTMAVAFVLAAGQAHADPNALWTIVHDRCVPDERASGDPAPCSLVDVAAGERYGYAVLKDLVGATQFLLIPTERISGIDSPNLLAPDVTNYFAAAWRARTFVEARAGVDVPRDWLSLAINSALAGSQDQLHIHIDCVRADVHDAVIRHVRDIGPDWTPFPEPLAGHPYIAMTVDAEDLDASNPVLLLADHAASAREDMGRQTLVAVGAYLGDGRPGFVLLAGSADPSAGNLAAGEELQDHDHCPPAHQAFAK